MPVEAPLRLPVRNLAREVEMLRYPGRALQENPGAEWCTGWLMRLGSFTEFLALRDFDRADINWLVEHGVDRKQLAKLAAPLDAKGCVNLQTVELLAKVFGYEQEDDVASARAYMEAALDYLPADLGELLKSAQGIVIHTDSSRARS
jgi:hypothetical protein